MARTSIAEKITLLPTERLPRRWGTTAALARIAARFHVRIKKQAIEIAKLRSEIETLKSWDPSEDDNFMAISNVGATREDVADLARILAKGKRGHAAEAISDLDHLMQRIDCGGEIRNGAVPVII